MMKDCKLLIELHQILTSAGKVCKTEMLSKVNIK